MSKVFISAKCSDLCFMEFEGIEHDGYVPDIPALGGGDYVALEIDNETGVIQGWKPLTKKSFKEAIGNEDEDEEVIFTKEELQESLRNGIYTIVFEKVNGEIREMRCTLGAAFLPPLVESENKAPKKENPDVLVVWDLDKEAWRSMRIDSIQTVVEEDA